MRLYGPKEVDKKALRNARIAILGYGSQGRAHALNLKDSGFNVVVGVRPGDSWKQAKRDGLEVTTPVEAVKGATLVAMLVPDTTQKALYAEIRDSIGKGATLLFAHGFNIHFKQIKPRTDLDVVLIAPKGPGDLVRRQYEQGRGVPAPDRRRAGCEQQAFDKALAYAHGIGGTRGGVLDDHVRRGDRDRSVRRAGRALRRRHRAGRARASRRWSRPATSPRSPTSSACTS